MTLEETIALASEKAEDLAAKAAPVDLLFGAVDHECGPAVLADLLVHELVASHRLMQRLAAATDGVLSWSAEVNAPTRRPASPPAIAPPRISPPPASATASAAACSPSSAAMAAPTSRARWPERSGAVRSPASAPARPPMTRRTRPPPPLPPQLPLGMGSVVQTRGGPPVPAIARAGPPPEFPLGMGSIA